MPDASAADSTTTPTLAALGLADAGHRAAMRSRLEGLRARHADAASPEAIAEVVEAVLATMEGRLSAPEAEILSQVKELGRTIAEAREEIALLHMDDINSAFIPSATDELDAIVDATAAATNEILDCVETVEKVAAALAPDQAEALRQATTRIYEACSFQDITGQRVTKVVATLKSIDARVHAIIATFGDAGGQPQRRPANDTAAPEGDTRLLNGPQLPGNGVDQASIDALFD
jgi:chemotaxis protein CheZ